MLSNLIISAAVSSRAFPVTLKTGHLLFSAKIRLAHSISSVTF
jgi:hypothetical protein